MNLTNQQQIQQMANKEYINKQYLMMIHSDITSNEADQLLKYVQSKGILYKGSYNPIQLKMWMNLLNVKV